MIGNKRLRVVGPSDDDYESARLDGLAETERFVIAVQWHEAVKTVPDPSSPPRCAASATAREGLGL